MANPKMNLTPEEIKKAFKEIIKLKKELVKLSLLPVSANDKYYQIEGELKEKIKEFLYSEFVAVLNKNQFLELCDLISTHRPVEPWQFLVTVSIRKKK